MKRTYYIALVLLLFFNPFFSAAQDTISLTIESAEESFLKKNLLLLAYKCNIDKQNALIIQSKVYPNPVFSANFNVYDPQNDIFFHTGKTGQKDFMFEQLILLGGKRKTSIEIAKTNKLIAEAEFADLLRILKYQLHKSFYSIYQYINNIEKYNNQLHLLDTLIKSYEFQTVKGNISIKDLIRLKSVYLKVNNEKAENIQLLNEENKNIQILIQEQGIISPIINNQNLDSYLKTYTIDVLETNALSNRPDLFVSDNLNKLSTLNLQLQKKSVIPDVAFNIATDQRGGAFNNQINAGLSLPIPLWNFNRGNIKAANFDLTINNYLMEERKKEIKAEVFEAFLNMERSIKEYVKYKSIYNEEFETVFKSVNENFIKKNITILEYVDFFEGYNDALKELQRIKSQIGINAAYVNYITGTKLY